MKRIIYIVIAVLLLTYSYAEATTLAEIKMDIRNIEQETKGKFKDIPDGAWYLTNVAKLMKLNIINGYEDGTFKPSNTVTKAQFIKMVVTALGHNDLIVIKDYWAKIYIYQAYADKILIGENVEATPKNYDTQITREEMAGIIARALKEEYTNNIGDYATKMSDYTKISDINKNEVLKVYSKGILTGYEDGTFKPQGVLTRAEAAAVIMRMLDFEARKYNDTLTDDATIKRLQAYAKKTDAEYQTGLSGEAVDFEKIIESKNDLIEYSYSIIRTFLKENQKKYEFTTTEFYTNKRLAYLTDRGILRIRGIIAGQDVEVDYGVVYPQEKYVLLKMRTLK